MAEIHTPLRNTLLQSLRPAAREFIVGRLLTRQLPAGEVLFRRGDQVSYAVFPHSGVISLMADMQDGRTVEKTSIGCEGLVGLELVQGNSLAISTSVVQVPGHASWMSRGDLDEALSEFRDLRDVLLAYSVRLIAQSLQTVACTSLHSAEQRTARWLLQADDRVFNMPFALTQNNLAAVLGLRRATVSEVCSALHERGMIDYSRGVIRVLDRDQLEHVSCECYARMANGGASAAK